MAKTVADVMKMKTGIKMVDLRFVDLPGTWQHFSIPASELTESLFEDGIGFDGSSIRGFQEIHESENSRPEYVGRNAIAWRMSYSTVSQAILEWELAHARRTRR